MISSRLNFHLYVEHQCSSLRFNHGRIMRSKTMLFALGTKVCAGSRGEMEVELIRNHKSKFFSVIFQIYLDEASNFPQ
jgi:hypothetical protein